MEQLKSGNQGLSVAKNFSCLLKVGRNLIELGCIGAVDYAVTMGGDSPQIHAAPPAVIVVDQQNAGAGMGGGPDFLDQRSHRFVPPFQIGKQCGVVDKGI
jgi:hypothetical protein